MQSILSQKLLSFLMIVWVKETKFVTYLLTDWIMDPDLMLVKDMLLSMKVTEQW